MPAKDDVLIGHMLIEEGLISAEQLEAGLARQKKTGDFICTTLVKLGFAPEEFNADVLLNKRVSGVVTNEKYLLSTSRFSNSLTTDVNSVRVVVENMKTIRFDYYQMLNMKSNCYGWRDTVLEASGFEAPADGVFINTKNKK